MGREELDSIRVSEGGALELCIYLGKDNSLEFSRYVFIDEVIEIVIQLFQHSVHDEVNGLIEQVSLNEAHIVINQNESEFIHLRDVVPDQRPGYVIFYYVYIRLKERQRYWVYVALHE
jgi:hypothetical protein